MTWLNVITAVLTLGAVARVTRLITDDSITAPLRDFLDRAATLRASEDGQAQAAPLFWRAASTWVHCAWCVSLWVATAAAVTHWQWADTVPFLYITGVLTASHLVALGADWLDSPPPPRVVTLSPVDLHLTQDSSKPSAP